MIQKNQTPQPSQSKKQKKLSHQEPSELTFLEHVHELRKRLFWVVSVLLVTSAVGYQFSSQLTSIVMAPLRGQKLIYLTPGGGFSFIFTIVIYFGILLTIPFAVYHIYGFLQPLLKNTSKRFIATFIFLSALLAAGGALFGYFVAVPAALNFLSTFAGDAVTPSLTADSYLSFVVAYVVGLAVLFQLPLLLFLFDHIRPFPPGTLSSTQRFVIIGATVIAAIITPTPDAFNMAIVAAPIIFVYEIGAFAVFVRRRGQRRRDRAVAAMQPVVPDLDLLLPEPLTASIDVKPVVSSTSPAASRPVPASKPVVQVQQQAAVVRPRNIDGFMPRQAPAIVRPQPRPVPPTQVITPRVPVSRQMRSVDGFLRA